MNLYKDPNGQFHLMEADAAVDGFHTLVSEKEATKVLRADGQRIMEGKRYLIAGNHGLFDADNKMLTPSVHAMTAAESKAIDALRAKAAKKAA